MGQRNHLLGGSSDPPGEGTFLGGLYYTMQAANAHSSTALLTCLHTMAEVRLLSGLTCHGADRCRGDVALR